MKKGDEVIIIAPAGNADRKKLLSAIALIENKGYKVLEGKYLFNKHFRFAGTTEQRLHDVEWALSHPSAKAVFMARGGYGCIHLIDAVQIHMLRQYPKWIIGFSDITVFHNVLHNENIVSIHGTMPALFSQAGTERSVQHLFELLEGKKYTYSTASCVFNKTGIASGPLTGGNLSILCSLIGTKNETDTRGKILFIEEVGEPLYKTERMLLQLKRAGKLKPLAGLLVGTFSDLKESEKEFGKNYMQMIFDIVREYTYPVYMQFSAGHQAANYPLLLGATHTLSVGHNTSVLTLH
ncbi:MAG: LD-carboxypeptidase [Cytophagaceae bacterium]|nr:LD-carboxypeptidase [Cytophagaceae bacterium]MDW8455777.1 LD-carboxypeptidase [Cytophagaceae bacterium]